MIDNYFGHKVIVFALEHYNPLGLIRSLGENGINPIYFSIKRRYEIATKSKYISKVYRADSVEEGYKMLISEYGNFSYDERPYLLFSDDKSIGFFDNHYDEIKNKFICYNAGQQGRINQFMDKQSILELAKKYGFKTIDSVVVSVGTIPKNLKYPIITKDINPNLGSWKGDVYICNNEDELKNAYKKITSPIVQLQRFIDKKNEYALEGFTINGGKDMMIVTSLYWKYLIKGYYSPYHDVVKFENKDIEEKLKNMFSEIGFSGIFEAEFLIDKNDELYFMEINFRASAWNHSGSVAGMPLSFLWVKSMYNGLIDKKDYKDFLPFTDMSEAIDYGKRVDTGKISLEEWLYDFKRAKGTYLYDEQDPEPFKALFNHFDEFK